MSALAAALQESGGSAAHTARLKALLQTSLERDRKELAKPRSGYDEPVTVVIAGGLFAVVPVRSALRVDPDAANEREWSLTASLVSALAQATELRSPARPEDLRLQAGDLNGQLVLHLPGRGDAELAALAFDEAIAGVDRLRARAIVVPDGVIEPGDLRPVLRVEDTGGVPGAHDDPVPARRVARRILQRLSGMGKWGGYHTEFAHLARGFEGNDRALALEVGEALIAAGLLAEKPSVGQRHVFLDPRRKGDIERLIVDAQIPGELVLPSG